MPVSQIEMASKHCTFCLKQIWQAKIGHTLTGLNGCWDAKVSKTLHFYTKLDKEKWTWLSLSNIFCVGEKGGVAHVHSGTWQICYLMLFEPQATNHYRSRILSTTCSFVWICGLISPDFNQDLPFSQPTRPCCYSASCPREPINPPRVEDDSRLRRCHGRRHSGIQSLYLGRELGRRLRIQVH